MEWIRSNIKSLLCTIIVTLVLCIAAITSSINNFFTAVVLIILSVVLYFYSVIVLENRNYLGFRSVFSFIWVFTIGLASLRLTNYQTEWEKKTWIYLALAYLIFNIGIIAGYKVGEKIVDNTQKIRNIKFGRIVFELKENRLFYVCVVTTLISLICFVINIAIKGWVPFFVSNSSAYVHFYTRFHVFTVAGTIASGLCYYCIKKQKNSKLQKIILYLCILYLVFLMPILIVSRGTFMCSALSLTASIFYINKQKFSVLVLCVVVMFGVYELGSFARNYSSSALEEFFEPAEIVIDPNGGENNSDESESNLSFKLPGKVAFVYSYLTVGHDNFNEEVKNATEYTYGVRQLTPFNVILRSDKIDSIVENGENYLVRPHLTTVNLIGQAYYDGRGIAIAILVFLWATVFGAIECIYLKRKKPFALLALGNALTPIALCFFESWMSIFSFWLLWGTALLMCICACISMIPKKNN